MKIVFICNEYPPAPHGGIGTFIHTIAHGIKTAGHEVSVVGIGEIPGEYDDEGVRIVILPQSKMRGISWWANRNIICRWLKKEAAAGNIDIVEAPEFQGSLISRPRNLPVVLRLHLSATAISEHAGKQANVMTRFCEKRCLSLFRVWIPVSKFALELTESTFGIKPSISKIIYNPITLPDEDEMVLPVLPTHFVLYAGGTVSSRKGAYILAMAAKQFLRLHPNLHLLYIGPLLTENGIPADERIIGILGAELARRVFFTGRVSRNTLMAYMKYAVVFCYPSMLETFGLVTAEAMMQGCPVVVCDSGPCPEFVVHKQTGILVRPNDPDDLANEVNWLLENREAAKRIASAGQHLIRTKFTLQRCVEDTLSFYEECMARQR